MKSGKTNLILTHLNVMNWHLRRRWLYILIFIVCVAGAFWFAAQWSSRYHLDVNSARIRHSVWFGNWMVWSEIKDSKLTPCLQGENLITEPPEWVIDSSYNIFYRHYSPHYVTHGIISDAHIFWILLDCIDAGEGSIPPSERKELKRKLMIDQLKRMKNFREEKYQLPEWTKQEGMPFGY